MLMYNLKKADKILSTSHVMAKETNLYTDKNIEVTPFGIDTEQFKPMEVQSLFAKDDIVIGTIKTLEKIYGIEYLIKAFKILSDKHKELPLKLLIVGGGSLHVKLKELAKSLNLEDKTIFTGEVPFNDTPNYHNMISVSVTVSNSESFGVSVLEAAACSKPVVVSNVGGLPEVVEDSISGFVVPSKNPKATALAIEKIILDPHLKNRLGQLGRKRVKRLYNLRDNINHMLSIYKSLI